MHRPRLRMATPQAICGYALGSSQQVDVWSEGQQIQTVNFQRKLRFAEFLPAVERICEAVWNLSEVELQLAPGCHIPIEYDRLLRIFSRRYGGARCRAELVGGGLSRAKVFRLILTSTDGSLIHNAIAKLGSIEDVREEGRRFETYVSRLGPAATPRKLHVLEHGAKMTAGVFYQLAADVHADAFSTTTAVAAAIPGKLKDLFSPWREGVPETRHAIKEIRRVLLSDEDLKRILSRHPILWINEFEARQIQVKWCCIHGDLHGKNVLLGENGSVVVIDYGDVGQGTASLDPITFELSLHFHPEGPFKDSGWPTLGQAAQWGDLDKYLDGCPNPLLIREIRRWTDEVAAAKREVAASAYAYLIRQLKYSDNNPDLILALLDAIYLYFMST